MLYQQTAIVIEQSLEKAWVLLQSVITAEESIEFFPGCRKVEVQDINESANEIIRVMHLESGIRKERVLINYYKNCINCIIIEHPFYQGETLFQLLRPSEYFLAESYCSLVIIAASRLHPGILAAPNIDDQEFIEGVARRIKSKLEIV